MNGPTQVEEMKQTTDCVMTSAYSQTHKRENRNQDRSQERQENFSEHLKYLQGKHTRKRPLTAPMALRIQIK